MSDVWERLSLYESRDLVNRFYNNRHGRQLNTKRAKEITSHFAQGREYFYNAKQAAELVRPLLFYYGILSFSRGLIIFLDSNKWEENLKPQHGLKPVESWGDTLNKGIKELPNLTVQFQNGTFSELSQATENVERSVVFETPQPGVYRTKWENKGTKKLPNGDRIAVKEILGRIPDLCDLFIRTFDDYAHCYLATVLLLNDPQHPPDETQIAILKTAKGLPSKAQVRKALQLPQKFPIGRNDYSLTHFRDFEGYESLFRGADSIDHLALEFKHTTGSDKSKDLPSIKNDSRNLIYLVQPMLNGVELSSLSYLFLIAYVMGTLSNKTVAK